MENLNNTQKAYLYALMTASLLSLKLVGIDIIPSIAVWPVAAISIVAVWF